MAGIKEIRIRISSVTSTQKITSAMKMVSAAKLRKAQTAVQQMRPYAEKLQEILVNLSSGLDSSDGSAYSKQRELKKVCIVFITSNSGLCGAFNSNVVKHGINLITTVYSDLYSKGNVHIISIGKKAKDVLKAKGFNVNESYNDVYDNMNFSKVSGIASLIMKSFVSGEYDKVEMIYNKFRNAASQDLVCEQYLPVDISKKSNSNSKFKYDYIFEPNQEFIVRELIPKSLRVQFYSAMLESFASEHGARMTAMHKATDNAGDMLRQLKLDYNKVRQSLITNEILEIVSGANALKS